MGDFKTIKLGNKWKILDFIELTDNCNRLVAKLDLE